MAKPSEKYSIVPQALRDKFREYKKKERAEDMKVEKLLRRLLPNKTAKLLSA